MLKPKPNMEKVRPVVHGGPDHVELAKKGISPAKILDFSVSTNPFGPPPGIKSAIMQAPIGRYPDSESIELKSILSQKLDLSPGNLLIGSGSTELIRLIVMTYFDSGDTVIVPGITYGEYEISCRIAGTGVIKQPLSPASGWLIDTDKTAALIRKHRPKGIFLCNPNNPTGQYFSLTEFTKVLNNAGDSLVILDEAYIAFTDRSWESSHLINAHNLIILRSMTKDYALAGLRLGYAVACQSIISTIQRIKPPWNVSSVAQNAGVFALKSDDYINMCRERIRASADFLKAGLKRLDYMVLPSRAHFFLVKVGDAVGFREALLSKSIMVRDCTSFGLPEYVRIAPRSMTDCRKLLSAIKSIRGWQNDS